jgi:acyl-coenzyme A synthetase/AMP-(fatty) acid ligase
VPKELIVRDQLPRNPSGKVLKRLLRDELQRLLQAVPIRARAGCSVL